MNNTMNNTINHSFIFENNFKKAGFNNDDKYINSCNSFEKILFIPPVILKELKAFLKKKKKLLTQRSLTPLL